MRKNDTPPAAPAPDAPPSKSQPAAVRRYVPLRERDPDSFVREVDIIGDAKASPPIPAFIPLSRTQWYLGTQLGYYPKGVKLSERTRGYCVREVLKLADALQAGVVPFAKVAPPPVRTRAARAAKGERKRDTTAPIKPPKKRGRRAAV